jgi:hypothetical protein
MTFIALPAWAARELVDDFNGATIDFTKWSGFDPSDDITEYFVRISTDDDNLVLINVGDGTSLYRDQRSRTWVLNPVLSAIEATISVVSVEDGGSKAAANLEGQYYNANSAAPADQNGDVFATVSIGDRGNGLEAWWEIHVSTHSTFESWNETSGTIIAPGTLNLNTAYVAKIEYDSNKTFTFTVNGTSSDPVLGPDRVGLPNFIKQNLSTSTRCCGANPSIKATFDDVLIGNVLLDNFVFGPYLDRSKWANHSGAVVLSQRIEPTITGKLFMFVSDENILQNGRSSTDLVLRKRNPDRIEAQVLISSDSMLEAGLRGRARLNGYAYNELRDGGIRALPYDGCDGDVWVQVEIDLKDGGLYATAFSGPETAGCDTERTLISETFTKLLAFDTEYLLWIERDGKKLMLGLDDEVYEHTITTPIYPPSPTTNNGFRRLSARIQGTSTSDPTGADGVFEMLVDNVYVQGSNEDSKGDDSCFIATAAYGSYLDPHVLTLRKFRDQHLLTNSIGTWFVEFYYHHSPPLADYIRERETLRALVRSGLAVVIYSIEYPTVAGLILLLPVLILIRQRRRRINTISNR